jgi:hypothetical protein
MNLYARRERGVSKGADASWSKMFDLIHAANNAGSVFMQSAAAQQWMNFFRASMMGRSLESDSFA